jgi:hypothetical protein
LHERRSALKALPDLTPPRDRWPVIMEAYMAARRRTRRVRLLWGGLAAAAVMVLALGLSAVLEEPTTSADAAPEIDVLVQQSQRLEDVLRTLRPERRVMSGYTATAIVNLEDRIAALDAGIGAAQDRGVAPAELRRLWQERVVLMDALVNTHVQRVAYVGF